MTTIASFVFFDLEATGLPRYENNKTKITELSLVAVSREHLLESHESPRVQNKLTMCFNPQRMIQEEATHLTGLCNDLLEIQPPFNEDAFVVINAFLEALKKPICLIAYNGTGFDFPILKRQLDKLNVKLSDDVMCADSFFGFYDILNDCSDETGENSTNVASNYVPEQIIQEEFIENASKSCAIQELNENTPKKNIINTSTQPTPKAPKARRRLPWDKGCQPKESYKLTDVHYRMFGRVAKYSHTAEGDCQIMLKCAAAFGGKFVMWVEENCEKFSDIKPMTTGVKIGY